MEEKTLTQIMQEYGITRRAIQGYEKNELVTHTGKTERGYLLYDEAAVKRIREIRVYQELGFQVKVIKVIMDAPVEVRRQALIEKRAELNQKVGELSELIKLINEMIEKL